jgi:putative hydrolase of the HAD superfamily
MSRIRAVISDFGGVLTNPLWEAFAAWNENVGADPAALGTALQKATEERGSHPLYELEKGQITEDEFTAIVQAQLPEAVELSGFRDVWFANLHANEPMIELMRELRDEGYRMAILTNNVREWEELWRAKLPVDEIFELIVDSAWVGMRKPDPAIYRLVLERLGDGLEPSACLFVDDNEANVEAARELGMTVVHFRATEQAIEDIRAAVETATARASQP